MAPREVESSVVAKDAIWPDALHKAVRAVRAVRTVVQEKHDLRSLDRER